MHDSLGTKNEPQYAGSGKPASGADLTELGEYAAKVGNRKAGTSADRAGLTGNDAWPGLEFSETDTGATYLYTSASGWKLRSLPLTAWTPTVGNVGTSSVYARYKVTDGVVTAFIRIVVSSAPSTNPTVSLPIAADTAAPIGAGLAAYMERVSDGTYIFCAVYLTSSTQVAWYPEFSTGSPAYVRQGLTVSATNPFTWLAGDVIGATLTYPLP